MAFNAHNDRLFGGLSISSLGSEERSVASSDAGHQLHNLFRRLESLEDEANFLQERPIFLSSDHDAFTEVEIDHCQEFELRVSNILSVDVLCVTVLCLPDYLTDDLDLNLCKEPHEMTNEDQNLKIWLKMADNYAQLNPKLNSSTTFEPTVYNGEYCFALTSAHGLCEGTYILSVENSSQNLPSAIKKQYQSVRVSYKVEKAVNAVSLENSKSLTGQVGLNEFTYFR